MTIAFRLLPFVFLFTLSSANAVYADWLDCLRQKTQEMQLLLRCGFVRPGVR